MLQNYKTISTKKEQGRLQPLQFEHTLHQCDVDPNYSFYHHTLINLHINGNGNGNGNGNEEYKNVLENINTWKPKPPPSTIEGRVPNYCRQPSKTENNEMQKWIKNELLARCHPTRLWVPCEDNRTYSGFIPCPQELSDDLAEDYAASKNWCDFNGDEANIPELVRIDKDASKAFTKPSISTIHDRNSKIRIAFFFTIYTDDIYFRRMLNILWSPQHFYLIHVDPTGSTKSFKKAIKKLKDEFNVKSGGSGGK